MAHLSWLIFRGTKISYLRNTENSREENREQKLSWVSQLNFTNAQAFERQLRANFQLVAISVTLQPSCTRACILIHSQMLTHKSVVLWAYVNPIKRIDRGLNAHLNETIHCSLSQRIFSLSTFFHIIWLCKLHGIVHFVWGHLCSHMNMTHSCGSFNLIVIENAAYVQNAVFNCDGKCKYYRAKLW